MYLQFSFCIETKQTSRLVPKTPLISIRGKTYREKSGHLEKFASKKEAFILYLCEKYDGGSRQKRQRDAETAAVTRVVIEAQAIKRAPVLPAEQRESVRARGNGQGEEDSRPLHNSSRE